MKIAFLGHAFIPAEKEVKEEVKEQIRNNLLYDKFITCYLGGYGDFDRICACACRELKGEGVALEMVFVSPYISLSQQEKIKENQRFGLYDAFIYPPLENVPPQFAISKRNEWMLTNADVIIAYVNHEYGRAYKFFNKAKRANKNIINICDFF